MNDDAIFLVVFFCTAALSGLWSSLDDLHAPTVVTALQTVPQAAITQPTEHAEHRPDSDNDTLAGARRAPQTF
jgi:hypothetical protein